MFGRNFNLKIIFLYYCLIYSFNGFAQVILTKDSMALRKFEATFKYKNSKETNSFEFDIYKVHKTNLNFKEEYTFITNGNFFNQKIDFLHKSKYYNEIFSGKNNLDDFLNDESNLKIITSNRNISQFNTMVFGNGNDKIELNVYRNFSKNTKIGLGYRRNDHTGYFLNNKSNNNNSYFYISTVKKNINCELLTYFNNLTVYENNGFINDALNIYDASNWKDAEVNLKSANNKLRNYSFNLKNEIILGSKVLKVNSSDTSIEDKEKFSIINNLKFTKNMLFFDDYSVNIDNYGSLITDSSVKLFSKYYRNSNFKFSSEILFNSKKTNIAFSFNPKLIYDYNNVNSGINENENTSVINNQVTLMSDFDMNGNNFNFSLQAIKPINGYLSSNYHLNSKFIYKIGTHQFGTSIDIFSQKPGFEYERPFYISYKNINNFENTNSKNIAFSYQNQKLGIFTKFDAYKIDYDIFFNNNLLAFQDNNNIYQFHVKKEFKFKKLLSNIESTYQSGYSEKLWLNLLLGLNTSAFKDKMKLFAGTDISFFPVYKLQSYNALLMQIAEPKSYIDNKKFPIIDLFLNAKVSTVVFSLSYTNVLSIPLSKNIYIYKYLPLSPSTFLLKVNWTFLD